MNHKMLNVGEIQFNSYNEDIKKKLIITPIKCI